MTNKAEKFTVQKIASLARVSVKTLYHYEKIGLLKPIERSEAGYRYYSYAELKQLQQILLYREMDLPLKEIHQILRNKDFDPLNALKWHRVQLLQKMNRMQVLLQTIDKSIAEISDPQKQIKMKTEELYEGFRKEESEAYREEAKRRWPKEFESTEANLKKMNKAAFEKLKAEGVSLVELIGKNSNSAPENETVQSLIGQYHQHLSKFNPIDKNAYMALGDMYVEDERFKKYYEKFSPGLALFIRDAIKIYCA